MCWFSELVCLRGIERCVLNNSKIESKRATWAQCVSGMATVSLLGRRVARANCALSRNSQMLYFHMRSIWPGIRLWQNIKCSGKQFDKAVRGRTEWRNIPSGVFTQRVVFHIPHYSYRLRNGRFLVDERICWRRGAEGTNMELLKKRNESHQYVL